MTSITLTRFTYQPTDASTHYTEIAVAMKPIPWTFLLQQQCITKLTLVDPVLTDVPAGTNLPSVTELIIRNFQGQEFMFGDRHVSFAPNVTRLEIVGGVIRDMWIWVDHVETLCLRGCDELTNLSLCCLALRTIDICTPLISLTSVIIDRCGLTQIPEVFRDSLNMNHIRISKCAQLTTIRKLCNNMHKLKYFKVAECPALISLSSFHPDVRLLNLIVNGNARITLDSLPFSWCAIDAEHADIHLGPSNTRVSACQCRDAVRKRMKSPPWKRNVHTQFGSNVNNLFAALLLGLTRIDREGTDPEIVEESLESFKRFDAYIEPDRCLMHPVSDDA